MGQKKWEIDQNFELHLTAMDPEMGRLIQEKEIDKSEIERGVSLRLIGLYDTEVARQSIVIRRMTNRQRFVHARSLLLAQPNRLFKISDSIQFRIESE